MLDDDDGTPDMDIHPLEWTRDIHKYGVNAVVLCRKSGWTQDTSSDYMRLNTDGSIAQSDKKNNRMFVRVHMEDKEKFILRVTKDMTVRDIFPLIVKKRQSSDMPPEQYNFFYLSKEIGSDPLDQRLLVKDLGNDNLRLVHKVPGSFAGVSSQLPSTPSATSPSHFMFTKETAFAYSEYRVVKTNSRGRKQKRILGLDATRIWNKQIGLNVRHPYRLITSVHSCEVLSDPGSFVIVFDETPSQQLGLGLGTTGGKVLVRREYRTETQVETAEIVAKLQFLMKNQPKS